MKTINVIQFHDSGYVCFSLVMHSLYSRISRNWVLTLVWSNNDYGADFWINTILFIRMSMSRIVMFVIDVYFVEVWYNINACFQLSNHLTYL